MKAITLQNEVVTKTQDGKIETTWIRKVGKFQDTELLRVEVTLWTLDWVTKCYWVGVCMYKWKRRRDSMFDQGVVSIVKDMKNEV